MPWRKSDVVELWTRKFLSGLCRPERLGKKVSLLLSVGLAVRVAASLPYAMSERKNQLITICMLIGALAMIGLALTGTLQMRVSHTPVAVLAR
jgi:hypothetical protein